MQKTMRGATAALLALAGAVALDSGPLSAQQWVPIRSGLPWASGANGGDGMADLQAMRGRRLDARTIFTGTASWNRIVASAPWIKRQMSDGAAIVVAVAMLPASHRGQHAACARGAFDASIRSFGSGLVANGGAKAALRLGWEANRLNGFAWAVAGDGADYKRCFRRWVSVLRSVPRQRFAIDWNMQDKSVYPPDRMYPGNDVVDIVGVNVFDRCPPYRNEAQWTKYTNSRHKDGRNPRGLATWLRFARERGKKLSVPEWGVSSMRNVKNCSEPGFDNPFFIRKMHEFFRANASSLAYEAYFNGHGEGGPRGLLGSAKVAPAYHNPRASAAYRQLWGR